jgi:flagellar basal body-associated protein FliL
VPELRTAPEPNFSHPIIIIIIIIIITVVIVVVVVVVVVVVSCHRPFLSGTSLEPAVTPTAQASSFTLQYFPYCV